MIGLVGRPDALLCYCGLIVTSLAYIWGMFNVFSRGDENVGKKLKLVAALLISGGGLLAAMLLGRPPLLWQAVTCCSLLAVSHALFWTAASSHGNQKPAAAYPNSPPTQIVRWGPYVIIRHPFYLSYILLFAAAAIATQFLWAWIFPTTIFVIYYLSAIAEEKQIMTGPHRQNYEEYCQTTGRLFPKLNCLWRRISQG